MNNTFSLSGKWAVVTGASKGLGAGMACALAEAGANLILVARGPMEATMEDVRSAGGNAMALQADLSKRDETKGLLESLDRLETYPEILVNNAGAIRRNPLPDFTEADWDEVIELNLSSIFLLSQGVARRWLKTATAGRIINIASMLSFQGGIRVPSYTASKTGLVGLTRLMANELAPAGICVNAIAPGYMETENTAPLREDAERNAEILARIPAGRWGSPDDLGGAVVFLASGASAYVNGITLPVDGGWLAR
ncbi:MAG: 2-dehydro-3-deoxy-D-gluconate 5-dehydrogenase KduD [Oceanipulchritudo sp.]